MASVKKRPDGKWRARYRGLDGREHARHFARKVDAERWLIEQEHAKQHGPGSIPRTVRSRSMCCGRSRPRRDQELLAEFAPKLEEV
jgi:hypothetical protein